MKIEKVNDNQIRCTLTREDLASREIKLSELAYGTEKAKLLFRDMMQQANYEFGFDAEDIPLMIEAIPLNSECIVLVITKVEDPEELDTRFSRFSPSAGDAEEPESDDLLSHTADDVKDLFQRIQQPKAEAEEKTAGKPAPAEEPKAASVPRSRTLVFESLNALMKGASVINDRFTGNSTLFKENSTGRYFLLLTAGDASASSFDRASNTLSEYGSPVHTSANSEGFFREHFEVLIAENAIASLASD